MTARYVRENGFHRVAVLQGTLRQYCQYYKALSELVVVQNVQRMNKGLLIGSRPATTLLDAAHVSLCAHRLPESDNIFY